MVLEDRFHRVVLDALARDKLVLPTLPEIALHVRQLAQREDVSAAALALELQKDPALSVRLLRVANSARSEEHTSELQSLMRISYAVLCLNKTKYKLTQSLNTL